MQKLDLNNLISCNYDWKQNLKPEEAKKYIHLSRKLLHSVIDNDGVLSGIMLSFPEDCLEDDLSNYHVFMNFLKIVGGSTSTKKIQGSYVVTFL